MSARTGLLFVTQNVHTTNDKDPCAVQPTRMLVTLQQSGRIALEGATHPCMPTLDHFNFRQIYRAGYPTTKGC